MTISLRTILLAAGLAGALSAQKIEENDPSLTYQGTWSPVQDANASGGSYTMSATVGSSLTVKVSGTNFVLYRKMDTNGGYASVTVDGQPFGSLTFYSVQTVYQVPAGLDDLGAGAHTIVLTVAQNQPAGSGGNNVYIDALQIPAPSTLGPTQAQLDAVTRANYYRNIMGLPPARHHLALGMAANAHAKYLSDTNFLAGGDPHIETLGASPDFTAARPADRDAFFGYTGLAGIEDSNNNPDPVVFVDGWMDGVYHRTPFLTWSYTEAGFGGYPQGATMDFGVAVLQPANPPSVTMTTYPANAQTDVWPFYDGSDGPNNVTQGNAYGYPISATFSFPANAAAGAATATPTTGTLTDAAGNSIPVTIADGSTDGQVNGTYFMIPNQPLALSTMYTATMAGVDPQNNSFSKSWIFTTANPNSVHTVRSSLGTNTFIYTINWSVAGTGVTSQVEYGPTTSYGNAIVGAPSFNGVSAQVAGIATSPTTHFRVTSKDAQGNYYASPDHTITVANPVGAATVGFVQVNPASDDTSFQWETAGTVTSTQVNYGPTTAYGSTSSGNLFAGATTMYSADLQNLASGTYHYQVTATDAQGNVFNTPDATFVIP